MRIALVAEPNLRQYVSDILEKHKDSGLELSVVFEQKPREEISTDVLAGLKNSTYNCVLLAIHYNHCLSRLLTAMHDEGISNVYVIRLFTLDTYADFISGDGFDLARVDQIPEADEKPYLVHLETHVCDNCNLNCKACNNFSPFVKERRVTDPAQFERDVDRLSELFSNIGRFFLLGGEPLLEPDLCCEMVGIARRYFPNAELRVLTNAILINKMTTEFWECLRQNGVIIHISLYPPVKEKFAGIETILQIERIPYIISGQVTKFSKRWTLFPFEDAEHNNNRCGSAGCHYLREGILAKCPDDILIGNMARTLECTPAELQGKHIVSLSDDLGSWEIIRQLNSPCDTCKKCTYRRIEVIDWEVAGASPEAKDWILENRLEYESRIANEKIAKMAAQQKAVEEKLHAAHKQIANVENELKKSVEQNKTLSARIEKQANSLKNLEETVCELKIAKKASQDWHTRFDQKDRQLKDCEKKYNALNKEYCAVTSSFSFRLGRALTWLLRKLRGGVRCLKENGMKYTVKLLLKKIGKQVLPESFIELNKRFYDNILAGVEVYSKLLEKYGGDVTILGCAFGGTGDYYICGLYLEEWLKEQTIKNYIFLCHGGSEKNVAMLFDSLKNHVLPIAARDFGSIFNLRGFIGPEKISIAYFHHVKPVVTNPSFSITNSALMGFHGLNMVDFYLYSGFKLLSYEKKSSPQFKWDEKKVKEIFCNNDLKIGKTVMLSPYSTGLKDYQPSMLFWERVATELKSKGYTVCTNCARDEKTVAGTVPVLLPYLQIVPFLNFCKGFIAVRSGLCDIISTSTCAKIILHPYKAKWWPVGNSIAYTGLNNMGLCNDAIEFEYISEKEGELFSHIMAEFSQDIFNEG